MRPGRDNQIPARAMTWYRGHALISTLGNSPADGKGDGGCRAGDWLIDVKNLWSVSVPALQDSKWSRLFGARTGARTGRLFVFNVHHGGLTIFHQSNTSCHSRRLDMPHMWSPASSTIVHLVPDVMPALICLDHLWGHPVQAAGT